MLRRVCDEMGSEVELGALQRGMIALKNLSASLLWRFFPPCSQVHRFFLTALPSLRFLSKCIHESCTINASVRAAELYQGKKKTMFLSSILRGKLTFRKAERKMACRKVYQVKQTDTKIDMCLSVDHWLVSLIFSSILWHHPPPPPPLEVL